MDNLPDFIAQVRAAADAVRPLHQGGVAQLAELGMQRVALDPDVPVRNGYYRAGPTLGIGIERPSAILFEHPERVGAEGPYPDLPSPIPAPDPGAIAAAAREIPFGQPVVIHNDVRHAPLVEHGAANMPARNIYQRAEAAVEFAADAVAQRIENEFARLGD